MNVHRITPLELSAVLDKHRMSGIHSREQQLIDVLARFLVAPAKPGQEMLHFGLSQVLACFNTDGQRLSDTYVLNQAVKLFADGYRQAKQMGAADVAQQVASVLEEVLPEVAQTAFWQAGIKGTGSTGLIVPAHAGLILPAGVGA